MNERDPYTFSRLDEDFFLEFVASSSSWFSSRWMMIVTKEQRAKERVVIHLIGRGDERGIADRGRGRGSDDSRIESAEVAGCELGRGGEGRRYERRGRDSSTLAWNATN